MNSENSKAATSDVFATPEQVRDSALLTRERKIAILKRWAYDAAEMAVAVEEGMPEPRPADLQRRILLALEALGASPDVERVGPTKQHGLPGDRSGGS